MFTIDWNDGPSRGFTDLLPSWWFKADGDYSSFNHSYSPRGRRPVANCSVSVKGAVADIDYGGDYAAHNKPNFPIGITRLIFTDTSRGIVQKVQWCDAGNEPDFEDVDVTCSDSDIAFETLETFDPADMKDGREKIERMVTCGRVS